MTTFFKEILFSHKQINFIILAAFCGVLTLVFEMTTILMIIPILKGKRVESLNIVFNYIGTFFETFNEMTVCISLFLFLGLFYIILKYITTVITNSTKSKASIHFQIKLLTSTTQTPLTKMTSIDAGHINHLLTKDIPNMTKSINSIVKIPTQLISIILIAIIGLYFSFGFFIGILFFISIISFSYFLIDKKIKKFTFESMIFSRNLNKNSFTVLKNIKYFSTNSYILKMSEVLKFQVQSLVYKKKKILNLKASISLIYESLGIILISIFLLFSYSSGSDYRVTIVLLGLYFRLGPSVLSIKRSFHDLTESYIAFQSYESNLNELKTEKNLIKVENLEDKSIIINNLKIKNNVNFQLDIAKLFIKNNERIYVKGYSGAGKSTFIETTLGFRLIENGRITIGENDITKYDLKKYISYLSSEVPFISGTLEDNLYFGDKKKTEVQLKEALRLSRFDLVMAESKISLDSLIDINKVMFSQGQRQKLNLTRILLQDKPIWFLDEATNSIGSEEERLILKEILEVNKEKTIIFISHKDRNTDIFDRVISISNGIIN
jgi:ABC-type transport system involved in cytochrome bd biosynthesis fused ATPase/permease subunit